MASLNEEKMEEDVDGDYEPFDTEKERYINQDLMDKYDSQLFTTTRHWKTGPSQVKSKLKKKFRLELRRMASSQYESEQSAISIEGDGLVQGDGDGLSKIEERLKVTSIETSTIDKDCKSLLSRTTQLVKNVELHNELKNSNQFLVLSETQTLMPDEKDKNLSCFIDKNISPQLNV